MYAPKLTLALATLLLALTAPVHAAKPAAKTVTALTAEETADLTFMREEEKLARDTYHTLYEKYGLQVFANIESSEQSHMDALLLKLESYGLPDPAAGNLIGEFTDHELQDLYDTLIAMGSRSDLDGVLVGGLIEETDMEDIKAAMDRTQNADILNTYDNLMCGSRNHLRAFAANYEAMTGRDYKAQVLEQTEVDEILAGELENCGK